MSGQNSVNQDYFDALSLSNIDSDDEEQLNLENEYEVVNHANSPSIDSQNLEIYHNLSKIGNFADDMNTSNSLQLTQSVSAFVDIEYNAPEAALEFRLLQDLTSSEALLFSIFCLPQFVFEEDFAGNIVKQRFPDQDFLGLSFSLYYLGSELFLNENPNGSELDKRCYIPVSPILYNGEYLITLSKAHHALKAGRYILAVVSENYHLYRKGSLPVIRQQSIKVKYEIEPIIIATPITFDQVHSNSLHHSEIQYYRFMDPHFVSPLHERESYVIIIELIIDNYDKNDNSKKDIDMFISNSHEGLVKVNPTEAPWFTNTSAHFNRCYIDIHHDDVNLPISGTTGLTYIIGLCNNELDNFEYKLKIRRIRSPLIHDLNQMAALHYNDSQHPNTTSPLSPSNHSQQGLYKDYNVHVPFNQLTYFKFEVNPNIESQVAIVMEMNTNTSSNRQLISSIQTSTSGSNTPITPASRRSQSPTSTQLVSTSNNKTNHRLCDRYTHIEELKQDLIVTEKKSNFMLGVHASQVIPGFNLLYSENKENKENKNSFHGRSEETDDNFDSEIAPDYVTIIYISNSTKIPNEKNYTWRAIGYKNASFVINSAEWKYISSYCYFSVFCTPYNIEISKVILRILPHDDYSDDSPVSGSLATSIEDKKDEDDIHLLLYDELDLYVTNSCKSTLVNRLRIPFLCSYWCQPIADIIRSKSLQYSTEALLFGPDTSDDFGPSSPGAMNTSNLVASLPGSDFLKYDIFTGIFQNIDGHEFSYRDRDGVNFEQNIHARDYITDMDDYNLTYHEIQFYGFHDFLQAIGCNHGQIFYDLGSGTGKVLLATVLSQYRFFKIIGIEILPSLANVSKELIFQLTSNEEDNFLLSNQTIEDPSGSQITPNSAPWLLNLDKPRERSVIIASPLVKSSPSGLDNGVKKLKINKLHDIKTKLKSLKVSFPLIEVRQENFLESDWSDGDILFASSLCYSDSVMDKLIIQATKLKKGAKIVTAKLPECYEPWFTLEKTVSCPLECGKTDFYVLTRTNIEFTESDLECLSNQMNSF